jgi:hypothetical protein
LNATEAHLRFRLLTRESMVRYLLVLLASWGVLSTAAVAVLILSKDPDPDHWVMAVFLPLVFIIPLVLWLAGRGLWIFWKRMTLRLERARGHLRLRREPLR